MRATEGVAVSRGQDLGLVSHDERLFVESGRSRAKNGHRSQKSIDGKVLFFYRTFQITGSSPRTGTSQASKKWWLRISNPEFSPVDSISLLLLHPTLFRVQGTQWNRGSKRMQEPEMGRTTVSGQDLAVTQMNPQYLGLPTQDLHKIKRITSFSTEEGWDPPPSSGLLVRS